jgi:hypothetical protein
MYFYVFSHQNGLKINQIHIINFPCMIFEPINVVDQTKHINDFFHRFLAHFTSQCTNPKNVCYVILGHKSYHIVSPLS